MNVTEPDSGWGRAAADGTPEPGHSRRWWRPNDRPTHDKHNQPVYSIALHATPENLQDPTWHPPPLCALDDTAIYIASKLVASKRRFTIWPNTFNKNGNLRINRITFGKPPVVKVYVQDKDKVQVRGCFYLVYKRTVCLNGDRKGTRTDGTQQTQKDEAKKDMVEWSFGTEPVDAGDLNALTDLDFSRGYMQCAYVESRDSNEGKANIVSPTYFRDPIEVHWKTIEQEKSKWDVLVDEELINELKSANVEGRRSLPQVDHQQPVLKNSSNKEDEALAVKEKPPQADILVASIEESEDNGEGEDEGEGGGEEDMAKLSTGKDNPILAPAMNPITSKQAVLQKRKSALFEESPSKRVCGAKPVNARTSRTPLSVMHSADQIMITAGQAGRLANYNVRPSVDDQQAAVSNIIDNLRIERAELLGDKKRRSRWMDEMSKEDAKGDIRIKRLNQQIQQLKKYQPVMMASESSKRTHSYLKTLIGENRFAGVANDFFENRVLSAHVELPETREASVGLLSATDSADEVTEDETSCLESIETSAPEQKEEDFYRLSD